MLDPMKYFWLEERTLKYGHHNLVSVPMQNSHNFAHSRLLISPFKILYGFVKQLVSTETQTWKQNDRSFRHESLVKLRLHKGENT